MPSVCQEAGIKSHSQPNRGDRKNCNIIHSDQVINEIMGTMPGMSLSPEETKHRAGQAGLSQPEPHMPAQLARVPVCCTRPPEHIKSPWSPGQ